MALLAGHISQVQCAISVMQSVARVLAVVGGWGALLSAVGSSVLGLAQYEPSRTAALTVAGVLGITAAALIRFRQRIAVWSLVAAAVMSGLLLDDRRPGLLITIGSGVLGSE